MEENNNKPVGSDSSDRPFSFNLICICGFPVGPRGGLVFGKIKCIWKVARSSKKFAYGVYRSENRAGTFLPGPLIIPFYYTTPSRTCQVFFEKKMYKKRRGLILVFSRAIVSVIITAVAECDFVGCVLVGVVAGVTASAFSVADVIITLVPHHRKVIALMNGVFQSALARNGGVGIVRAIPAINRAMNVLFHLILPRFPFARNRICRTCFHRCRISKSSHIADSS